MGDKVARRRSGLGSAEGVCPKDDIPALQLSGVVCMGRSALAAILP